MARNNNFFDSYKNNLLKLFRFLSSESTLTHLFHRNIGLLINNTKVLATSSKIEIVEIQLPCFEIQLNSSIKCGTETDSFLSIGGRVKFSKEGLLDQSISACISITPYEDINKCDSYCTPEMSAAIKHIIRRFHFDIDSTQKKGDRPISHIQYGGNINATQKGDAEYRLISSLDIPRIPSIPLDIVQVINFLMHQFNNDASLLFLGPAWRAIVIENDGIWKNHYFDKLINTTGKQKTLYEFSCSPYSFV